MNLAACVQISSYRHSKILNEMRRYISVKTPCYLFLTLRSMNIFATARLLSHANIWYRSHRGRGKIRLSYGVYVNGFAPFTMDRAEVFSLLGITTFKCAVIQGATYSCLVVTAVCPDGIPS